MFRLLIVATVVLASAATLFGQATTTLRIKAILVDADQTPTPVPRHALLISDDPPSAAPRRIFTGVDGTVAVTLRPGRYTVESDAPVMFGGKAYQWTVMVDVPAAGGATLDLTQQNAEIVPLAPPTLSSAEPAENDPAFLLTKWQNSVVAVWTGTTRASAFIADTRGLVVTSQRAVGDASSAEVQLTRAVKVAARLLVADVVRNVAVLSIDSSLTTSAPPLPLDCAQASAVAPLDDRQQVFAIGVPFRGPKSLLSGAIERLPRRVVADLRIERESTGGPVFTMAGAVAGLTSTTDDPSDPAGDARVIAIGDVCEVLKAAEGKMSGAAAPSATHLPVEPTTPFPTAALDEAAKRRVSDAIPYQISSGDFDISFITPGTGARGRAEMAAERRTRER